MELMLNNNFSVLSCEEMDLVEGGSFAGALAIVGGIVMGATAVAMVANPVGATVVGCAYVISACGGATTGLGIAECAGWIK